MDERKKERKIRVKDNEAKKKVKKEGNNRDRGTKK
jgi:hypothetical protein